MLIGLLINILITLLILGLIVYVCRLIIDLLPIDPPIARVAKIIIYVIVLLIFLFRILPMIGIDVGRF